MKKKKGEERLKGDKKFKRATNIGNSKCNINKE